jgi:hypothetical protein
MDKSIFTTLFEVARVEWEVKKPHLRYSRGEWLVFDMCFYICRGNTVVDAWNNYVAIKAGILLK